MSTKNKYTCNNWEKYHHTPAGRMMAGVILILAGLVLLTERMGVPYPEWLFSWPVFLITLSLYIGARHMFRSSGWLIMFVIGVLFLTERIFPDLDFGAFFWPVLIIAVGIFMIIKPRKSADVSNSDFGNADASETIQVNVVLSGIKKNIITKQFMGGTVSCVLGGAEINLSQSDIQGKVILTVNQVLGGTKLILPSNWEVQPEMTAIMGGIEDKRHVQTTSDENKVLVIRGTSILGGIEIKSY